MHAAQNRLSPRTTGRCRLLSEVLSPRSGTVLHRPSANRLAPSRPPAVALSESTNDRPWANPAYGSSHYQKVVGYSGSGGRTQGCHDGLSSPGSRLTTSSLIYLDATVATQVRSCVPTPPQSIGGMQENCGADRGSTELDVSCCSRWQRPLRGGRPRHVRLSCREGDDSMQPTTRTAVSMVS